MIYLTNYRGNKMIKKLLSKLTKQTPKVKVNPSAITVEHILLLITQLPKKSMTKKEYSLILSALRPTINLTLKR